MLEIPATLDAVVKDLVNAGGKAFLVGGAVLGAIQGRDVKDWDVEVCGIALDTLIDILNRHGNANYVGKCFGVVKLSTPGYEYDFNLPRRETKTGQGHKDFDMEFDPTLTPFEAAERRDLTINSMFYDLSTGILNDPFGGLEDLNHGVLRHTSEKFKEDPLRVLRIMQLLPRKGKTVAPDTIALSKSMIDEHCHLPNERLLEEWVKLLMKAQRPSLGLNFLVDCGWIVHYPELEVLQTTMQKPDWHPEGGVWNHLMLVMDNAAALREYVPEEWRRGYMFGMLLHDVGKAVTTTEDLKSPGHDIAGVPIAKKFMERLTDEVELNSQVAKIVQYHMQPGDFARGEAKESAWKRLHNRVRLDVMAYVSKADGLGKLGRSIEDRHDPSRLALQYFEMFGENPIPPVLMGRHLIARGYIPGPHIGIILRRAYDLQIEHGIQNTDELLSLATQ